MLYAVENNSSSKWICHCAGKAGSQGERARKMTWFRRLPFACNTTAASSLFCCFKIALLELVSLQRARDRLPYSWLPCFIHRTGIEATIPESMKVGDEEAGAWSYHETTSIPPQQDSIAQNNSDWRFTDFDHVPERSRDGSIHATDEVINAATHLAASMFSLLGAVLLISKASAQHAPWKIVSFSIYGASLIFLFVASTLHHSISSTEKVETFLRMMDYLAIYPLIAGTFTPLCLVFFHHTVIGWSFCMVVWALAIMGMTMTVQIFHKIPKWMSTTLYVTLGWLGACMAYWLIPVLGFGGFAWFLVGGIFYTVGGYIFSTECLGIIVPGQIGFHEVWHVLVMLGALCHYWLMWHYVLPWTKE